MNSRRLASLEGDRPFVHYCDADAALSMIKSQEVWMRNVTWMNDESEITHGIERLISAYNNTDGLLLKNILNKSFDGFTDQFEYHFSAWMDDFRQETYITCLTEQLEDEDLIGRLSMWRAYGRKNAIAFVLDPGPFLRPSDALKAYTSPVAYLNQPAFDVEFRELVSNIEQEIEWLSTIGRDHVYNNLFAAFRFAILCTKHPAFKEEKEWRIVYQPNFQSAPEGRILEEYRSIGGSPQRIFKIPLTNHPNEGLYGVSLPELLRYLIIGPGQDVDSLRREFIRLLMVAGVPDAASKVVASNVPLRRV